MTEITFDQIEVGDLIKVSEVYENGDTLESEFTVTHVEADFVYSAHRVFHKTHGDRESLTITRVTPTEPEKIGTVAEYKRDGVTRTVVKFSNDQNVEYQWILPSGFTLRWNEILAYDPNPKIKEN